MSWIHSVQVTSASSSLNAFLPHPLFLLYLLPSCIGSYLYSISERCTAGNKDNSWISWNFTKFTLTVNLCGNMMHVLIILFGNILPVSAYSDCFLKCIHTSLKLHVYPYGNPIHQIKGLGIPPPDGMDNCSHSLSSGWLVVLNVYFPAKYLAAFRYHVLAIISLLSWQLVREYFNATI